MTLGNLFIEQLVSNKQLLNEDSLSHWDRQNSLYLEEVCSIESCGVSQKVSTGSDQKKKKKAVPPVGSSYERCW